MKKDSPGTYRLYYRGTKNPVEQFKAQTFTSPNEARSFYNDVLTGKKPVPKVQANAETILAGKDYGVVNFDNAHNAIWIGKDGTLLGDRADHQQSAMDVLDKMGKKYEDEYTAPNELQKQTGLVKLGILDKDATVTIFGDATPKQLQSIKKIASNHELLWSRYTKDGKPLNEGRGFSDLEESIKPTAPAITDLTQRAAESKAQSLGKTRKQDVEQAALDYQRNLEAFGEESEATKKSETRYRGLLDKYEADNGKPAIEPVKEPLPELKSSDDAVLYGRANPNRASELEARANKLDAEATALFKAGKDDEGRRVGFRAQLAREAFDFARDPNLQTPYEKGNNIPAGTEPRSEKLTPEAADKLFERNKKPVEKILTPVEYATIEKKLQPMLDIHRDETGWKKLDVDDGTILVNPETRERISFRSSDFRSGTKIIEARAQAQVYAIDNPIEAKQIPAGELEVKNLRQPNPQWELGISRDFTFDPNSPRLKNPSGEGRFRLADPNDMKPGSGRWIQTGVPGIKELKAVSKSTGKKFVQSIRFDKTVTEAQAKDFFEKNRDRYRFADEGQKPVPEKLIETKKEPGLVQRALDETVTDMGRFSKTEKAVLENAVKRGVLVKGKGGPFPVEKTLYAKPGYDFATERTAAIKESLKFPKNETVEPPPETGGIEKAEPVSPKAEGEKPEPLTNSKLQEAAKAAPKAGLTLKEQKKTLLGELEKAQEIVGEREITTTEKALIELGGKNLIDSSAEVDRIDGLSNPSRKLLDWKSKVKKFLRENREIIQQEIVARYGGKLKEAGLELDDKGRIVVDIPGDGTFSTPIWSLDEYAARIEKGFPKDQRGAKPKPEPSPAPVVEALSPTPSPKEPWEMTKEEWQKHLTEKTNDISNAVFESEKMYTDKTARQFTKNQAKEELANRRTPENYEIIDTGNNKYYLVPSHKNWVAQAMKNGKPVPESVLKDYPDLKEKVGALKGSEESPTLESVKPLKGSGKQPTKIITPQPEGRKEPEWAALGSGDRKIYYDPDQIRSKGNYEIWDFDENKSWTFDNLEAETKFREKYPFANLSERPLGEEKTWYRYGKPPEGNRSFNYSEQRGEPGVSVSGYSPKESGATLFFHDRPRWTGPGRQIGWGSDGEPSIIPTGEWKKLSPELTRAPEGGAQSIPALKPTEKPAVEPKTPSEQSAKRESPRTGTGGLAMSGLSIAGSAATELSSLSDDDKKRMKLLFGITGAIGLTTAAHGQIPGFYSKLSRFISEKMPKAMTAEAFKSFISKGDVKAEELKWTGINDFIESVKGRPVTKAEVEQYVKDNQVIVQEVVKGEGQERIATRAAEMTVTEDQHQWHVSAPDGRKVDVGKGVVTSAEDAKLYAERYFNHPGRDEMTADETKFSQYQLPGSKEGSYRELLLTLPTRMQRAKVVQGSDGLWYAEMPDGKRSPYGTETREAVQKEIDASLKRANAGEPTSMENTFRSSHFDEPNVLAHIRFNERETGGKRTLFIEEIQSDWHQKGRKEGYRGEAEQQLTPEMKELQNLNRMTWEGKEYTPEQKVRQEYLDQMVGRKLRDWAIGRSPTVPDAPFKSTWQELSFRRMVKYAVDNGYDRIAWTKGSQQVDRYNEALRQNVDKIYAMRRDAGTMKLTPEEAEYHELVKKTWRNGEEGILTPAEEARSEELARKVGMSMRSKVMKQTEEGKVNVIAWKNNQPVFNHNIPLEGKATIAGKEVALEDVVGKSIAEKIRTGEAEQSFEGQDLTIGGEGMKGFYDKILVDYANKLGKGWGAKVEEADIGNRYKNNGENIGYGETGDGRWGVYDGDNLINAYPTREGAKNAASELRRKNEPVHAMNITPEMKKSVLEKGQSLFLQGLAAGSYLSIDAIPGMSDEDKERLKGILGPITIAAIAGPALLKLGPKALGALKEIQSSVLSKALTGREAVKEVSTQVKDYLATEGKNLSGEERLAIEKIADPKELGKAIAGATTEEKHLEGVASPPKEAEGPLPKKEPAGDLGVPGLYTDVYGKIIDTFNSNRRGVVINEEFAKAAGGMNDLNRFEAGKFSTTDYLRATEKIEGKVNGPFRKAVVRPLEDANFDATKEIHDVNGEFQGILKKNRIKKDSPSSKRIFQSIEGRLAGGLDANERAVANWLKDKYTTLLDRLNHERSQVNLDPIHKRSNYITHFQELSFVNEFFGSLSDSRIPSEVLKAVEFTKPNNPFFRFMLERKGGPYKEDAVGAFEVYYRPAISNIHKTQPLTTARAYVKHLPPNASRYFTDWLGEGIANKSSTIDRSMPESFNKILNTVSIRIGKNLILGNFQVLATQLSSLPQTFAEAGIRNAVKGIASTFTPEGWRLAEKYSEILRLREYEGIEDVNPSRFHALEKLSAWHIEAADRMMVRMSFNSGLKKALSEGKDFTEAVQLADDFAQKTQAAYGRMFKSPIMRSRTVSGTIGQFQVYTNNLMNYVVYDLLSKRGTPTNWQRAGKLATLLGGALAVNQVYDQLGLPAPWSPSTFVPFYNAFMKLVLSEQDRDVQEALGSSGKFGSPAVLQTVKDVGVGAYRVGGGLIHGNEKQVDKGFELLLRNVPVLALPYGGRQVAKSLEGIKAINEGGVRGASGKMLFKIEGLDEQLRTVFLGRYGSMAAQDYLKQMEEKRTTFSKPKSGVTLVK